MSQPAYAMPLQGYPAELSRTGAWGDYFRGFSIAAWLFLLIVSFWWLQKWDDIFSVRESGMDKSIQYIAFLVALIAHLTLGMSVLVEQTIRFWSTVKGRCLGGFCLLMLATSPLSLDPLRSALYSLATLGALLTCYWAWQMDYDRFRRIMLISAAAILAYLAVLTVHHGLSATSVGGIQRNKFGQAAFTAAICLFLFRGKLKWAGLAACLVFAVLVNSRGTMLASGLFVVTYLTLKYGMARSLLASFGLALAGVVFLALPKVGREAQDAMVEKVARVHDTNRGFGSGFSGRVQNWARGMDAFFRSPAIGHGFRTRTTDSGDAYTAHSGYVNLLADAGLAGFALVMAAFAYDFFKRVGAIRMTRRQFGSDHIPPNLMDTFELNCVICAFMVAQAELWLFEPLYLNLGSCLSILFLLLVMAPLTVGRGAGVLAYMPTPQSVWPYRHPAGGWA